jgi:hypothetical protein
MADPIAAVLQTVGEFMGPAKFDSDHRARVVTALVCEKSIEKFKSKSHTAVVEALKAAGIVDTLTIGVLVQTIQAVIARDHGPFDSFAPDSSSEQKVENDKPVRGGTRHEADILSSTVKKNASNVCVRQMMWEPPATFALPPGHDGKEFLDTTNVKELSFIALNDFMPLLGPYPSQKQKEAINLACERRIPSSLLPPSKAMLEAKTSKERERAAKNNNWGDRIWTWKAKALGLSNRSRYHPLLVIPSPAADPEGELQMHEAALVRELRDAAKNFVHERPSIPNGFEWTLMALTRDEERARQAAEMLKKEADAKTAEDAGKENLDKYRAQSEWARKESLLPGAICSRIAYSSTE